MYRHEEMPINTGKHRPPKVLFGKIKKQKIEDSKDDEDREVLPEERTRSNGDAWSTTDAKFWLWLDSQRGWRER